MLRPRHRGWRSWLWTERLQHEGSCKHQIPADISFLARFKVLGVRSQGEDPQGRSKIGLGCIHTFGIPSQGLLGTSQGQQLLMLWPFPKGQKHRAETGPPGQQRLVLKNLHPPKKIPPASSSPNIPLAPSLQNIPPALSRPASCLHQDTEGPVPARHPQLAASPPFELVSFSPSTAVRGKFGLG